MTRQERLQRLTRFLRGLALALIAVGVYVVFAPEEDRRVVFWIAAVIVGLLLAWHFVRARTKGDTNVWETRAPIEVDVGRDPDETAAMIEQILVRQFKLPSTCRNGLAFSGVYRPGSGPGWPISSCESSQRHPDPGFRVRPAERGTIGSRVGSRGRRVDHLRDRARGLTRLGRLTVS
jgi:hypothetical protein